MLDESDYPRYITDRLRQLEEKNLRLREEVRKIEAEKRSIEARILGYEREIRRLKAEIERLRSMPLIVGTVVDVLDDKVLVKSSSGPRFVVQRPAFLDLAPGTQVALNQQSLAIVDILPPSKDAFVMGMEVIERPQETYDDVGGLKQQIEEIREMVELPLKNPEAFEKVGIEPPKGILLIGPPGTGKTLLAKAVAHHTNSTFIKVVGSELVQKYIGEGARLVRELFQLARQKSPSIIFIDELDAIAARRLEDGTSGDREVQRTLMQLLSEMDGFSPRGDVKILAATNRPDILDPAILRPGRFDRIIEIGMPDAKAREEILMIHTRRMNVRDIDYRKLAEMLEGATGADIKAVCVEAGMFAIRRGRSYVTMQDFQDAIVKVLKKTTYESERGIAEMFV